MRQGASENWDLSRLEFLLKSKTKLLPVQQETFMKFWKIQRTKIAEIMIQKTKWNNSLLRFEWRIDVKAVSKDVKQMNEPTAIIEMAIGKKSIDNIPDHQPENNRDSSSERIVRFEMDREQLENTVAQMNLIHHQLSSSQ